MVGAKLGFSRVVHYCRQGYERLRFGHAECVRFVYETIQKVKHMDGVDSFEGVFLYRQFEVLDVGADLGVLTLCVDRATLTF